MKKVQFAFALLLLVTACSKKNKFENKVKEEPLSLQTAVRTTEATNATATATESTTVSGGSDSYTTTCVIPPSDGVVCEELFETVTAITGKIIKSTGGTVIIENPDNQDWKNLQYCFNRISVYQTTSASQISFTFKSNANGAVLMQRNLKVSTSNARLFTSGAVKTSSALTSSLLAAAARNPNNNNLARVLLEVYGPTTLRTIIN